MDGKREITKQQEAGLAPLCLPNHLMLSERHGTAWFGLAGRRRADWFCDLEFHTMDGLDIELVSSLSEHELFNQTPENVVLFRHFWQQQRFW